MAFFIFLELKLYSGRDCVLEVEGSLNLCSEIVRVFRSG